MLPGLCCLFFAFLLFFRSAAAPHRDLLSLTVPHRAGPGGPAARGAHPKGDEYRVPLYRSHGKAFFSAHLGVGTPPRVVSLVLDTRTSTTAIACDGGAYGPDASNSSRRTGHRFSASDSNFPGSHFAGEFVSDVLCLRPPPPLALKSAGGGGRQACGTRDGVRLTFGCAAGDGASRWPSALLSSGSSGILGFASKGSTVLEALFRARPSRLERNVFSFCLAPSRPTLQEGSAMAKPRSIEDTGSVAALQALERPAGFLTLGTLAATVPETTGGDTLHRSSSTLRRASSAPGRTARSSSSSSSSASTDATLTTNHLGPTMWSRLRRDASLLTLVSIADMTVAGYALPIKTSAEELDSPVIDTGAPLTHVPHSVAAKLSAAVGYWCAGNGRGPPPEKRCPGQRFGHAKSIGCWRVPSGMSLPSFFAAFPPIGLVLSGTAWDGSSGGGGSGSGADGSGSGSGSGGGETICVAPEQYFFMHSESESLGHGVAEEDRGVHTGASRAPMADASTPAFCIGILRSGHWQHPEQTGEEKDEKDGESAEAKKPPPPVPGRSFVLGLNVLGGLHVMFDRDTYEVGFAKADCTGDGAKHSLALRGGGGGGEGEGGRERGVRDVDADSEWSTCLNVKNDDLLESDDDDKDEARRGGDREKVERKYDEGEDDDADDGKDTVTAAGETKKKAQGTKTAAAEEEEEGTGTRMGSDPKAVAAAPAQLKLDDEKKEEQREEAAAERFHFGEGHGDGAAERGKSPSMLGGEVQAQQLLHLDSLTSSSGQIALLLVCLGLFFTCGYRRSFQSRGHPASSSSGSNGAGASGAAAAAAGGMSGDKFAPMMVTHGEKGERKALTDHSDVAAFGPAS